MLKKYKIYDKIETYSFKGVINGPLFNFGKIGSGKSVSLLSICQGYHDVFRYKVFDLDGGPRNEQLYWAIPSQDFAYWQKFKSLGTLDEPGPKQYKINFLYPFFESKFPKKLPKKIINGKIIVNSIPFTIPLKDVKVEDISVVLGILSETSKYCWNEILYSATKKDNAGSLMHFCKKIKGITNTPLYKNFVLPMSREKFLMDSYCDYNIDLKTEARDLDTISILCLDFVPKEFHMFIMNWIARTLSDLLDANRITKRNIAFMREAGRYFRATADSVLPDNFKIFRSNMADYIRLGRRGLYFALDCQSPSEVRGIVQGSEDFLLMFRMSSWRDKAEVTDELMKERRMRRDQVSDLAFLNPGQCFIAETARIVKKVQIRLPRTMYWKKEYGNFYRNVWEKYGGEWKNVEETFDNIDLKCDEMFDKYVELDKPKKDKETEKKALISPPIVLNAERNLAETENNMAEKPTEAVAPLPRRIIKRSVFS